MYLSQRHELDPPVPLSSLHAKCASFCSLGGSPRVSPFSSNYSRDWVSPFSVLLRKSCPIMTPPARRVCTTRFLAAPRGGRPNVCAHRSAETLDETHRNTDAKQIIGEQATRPGAAMTGQLPGLTSPLTP